MTVCISRHQNRVLKVGEEILKEEEGICKGGEGLEGSRGGKKGWLWVGGGGEGSKGGM